MRKLALLASVLMLTACASGMTFDRYLESLEGKPINDAELMLKHAPTGQYTDIHGATVYVWQDAETESIFGPAVTGRGGYQLGSNARGMNNDALIWSGIQFNSCVIRATVTDGIIRDVGFQGNPGGCETIYGARRRGIGHDAGNPSSAF